jgi:isoleucyl-tRNA synthetase
VDVKITQELEQEGLAREVVRRIQNLRKEAGFNLDDRIATTYQGGDDLAAAIEVWRDLIAAETLSVELRAAPPAEGAAASEERIGGQALKLGVRRV